MKSGSFSSNLIPFNSLIIRIFIVVILIFSSAVISYGDTHTWIPTTGGAWTTTTNWLPTGLPVSGDDIIVSNDQSANITAVPNLSINSLSVSGTCTLVGTGGGTTLMIGGSAGTDFIVSNGKTLTIGSNMNITLATNATSAIIGILTINTGRIFNTNGTGVVTTVSGAVVAIGNVTSTDAAKFIFQSGSTYNHATNGGTIPTATWADGSTCLISGVVATSPSALSLGQNFYNLTWNNPGQTWNPTTGSTTAGADYKVRGTFTFINSGTGSNIWPSINCNVANYVHTGGIDRLSYTNPRIHTIGNLSVTGGTVDFTQSTGAPVINISGNISVTGGTLTTSGAGGSAVINFVGTAVQTFISGGTISGSLYWNILNGSTVDFGNNVLSGSAASTFTLSEGGTIITANANGLATTGATGSVQVGGARTYNAAANYEYNGSAAQVTGNGLTGAANLTINNAAGITLTGNVAISDNLNLTNGIITTGVNVLSMATYASVSGADLGNYVFGNLLWDIGTGPQIKTFDIGDAGRYTPVTVVFDNVTTAGTLTGSTRGLAHPNLGTSPISPTKYVRRYYTLTNAGIVFNSSNITVMWGISDLVGFPDYSKFIVGKYSSGWTSPTYSSRTSTSIQATNLTSFGDFMVGETSCTTPLITTAPESQNIAYGTDAIFTAIATGTGLTYKWQEDRGSGFVNISDGGIYSNSTATTLSITKPAVALRSYIYRCVVTAGCGSPPAALTSSGATLTVTARDLVVSGLTVSDKVYDSTISATLGGIAVVTVLGSDLVTLGGTATGSFADKNVGKNKVVTVSGITISGTDALNYNLIQQSDLTADITKADLIINGLTASGKEYDGNTTAVLIGKAEVLVLGSDEVIVDQTTAGLFVDKNVGTGKTVIINELSISGADASNYTLTQPSLTADITVKALTLTADNKMKFYGEAIPELTISYSGLAPGDDESVISKPLISTIAGAASPAGAYPIILSGGSALNYTLSLVNGMLTINKASQTITFSDIPAGLRITEEHALEASASSGFPVKLESSNTNIVSISGNIMIVKSDGTVTITASQEGDNNWNPAPDVTKTVITLPTFDNISSLFTPNNDGINDYWYIPQLEKYGILQVTVYNRFGQAVYKSNSYKNDWDGTWNGYPLPSASYYYIMKSSVKGIIKGVVNIIR